MKRDDMRFNHKDVEKRCQEAWKRVSLDSASILAPKRPFYNLMMFPYPSAEGLHVGNMYAFCGSDIYGRYKRMQGFDVFEPIGLDGFGIHSENYALKIGRHPMDHASITQKNFYAQLGKIGAMFDWHRTLETYDPGYYRWTQWLFTEMFKHNLAYRKKASVNWCPSCKTVLADEQVIDGACERCGNKVEKRALEQWFVKITAYAEKLLENLKTLDWSDRVKTAQVNWIGKKEGINITYPVVDDCGKHSGNIAVFTTHPDTNYGATFVVIAPEHQFIQSILRQVSPEIAREINLYVKNSAGKSQQEREMEGRKKTGIFTGLYCVNHLTGYRMPLYVSDFVLMEFGTGVVVGVPAHDERDYQFATVFHLPIRKVVDWDGEVHAVADVKYLKTDWQKKLSGFTDIYIEDRGEMAAIVFRKGNAHDIQKALQSVISKPEGYFQLDGGLRGVLAMSGLIVQPADIRKFASTSGFDERDFYLLNPDAYPFCYTGDGRMINSDVLDGQTTTDAIQNIMNLMVEKGWGEKKTSYHLRDWLLSRQRYWGPPIPMIYCESCAGNGQSWFTLCNKVKSQSDSLTAKTQLSGNNDSSLKMSQKGAKRGQKPPLSGDSNGQTWDSAGWYPVPEEELPVVLPRIEDYKPGNDGVAPLAKHSEFYRTTCPGCGKPAVRETDVSDTFLDSAWYFLRYPSIPERAGTSVGSDENQSSTISQTPKEISAFDPGITKQWLPIHMYTGGAEHSVLHLLYSRFMTMALKDFGYIDFEEPFSRFFAHGLVIKDGAKMSKSKGNVVNPDEYIETYGSDALRMYLMFMGPFSQGGDFRDSAMEGMNRWVGRIFRMAKNTMSKVQVKNQKLSHVDESSNLKPRISSLEIALNKLIAKVGDDTEKRRYNTALASMMEFTNLAADRGGILPIEALKKFVLILAPYAPFLCEELWQKIHSRDIGKTFKPEESVHRQAWPSFDKSSLVGQQTLFIVQVNGKLRDRLTVPINISGNKTEVENRAKVMENVAKYLTGPIKKTIFVPGKLINFVI